MKELLSVFCAMVSVVSAAIAIDAMKKCAESEEKKTYKKGEDCTEDFNCSDDYCDCFDDIEVDDIPDVDINIDIEEPTESNSEGKTDKAQKVELEKEVKDDEEE